MGMRLTVVIPDECGERLVKLAGSSRKQGEYLAGLIDAAWANQVTAEDGITLESLRLQQIGLAAQSKAIDSRVLQLEKGVSALIAQQ